MQRSEILNQVHDYVSKAVSRLARQRYAQESAYVDAFLGRLDGQIDLGEKNGVIDLKATVVSDRGPGAAEHQFGADFALVFKSIGEAQAVNKAILAQAKNGCVEYLLPAERRRLEVQCEKMAKVTQAYLVLETPLEDFAIPVVRLGDFQTKQWSSQSMPFDEYLVDQVISCLHGDRRIGFIDAVGNSKLPALNVFTRGLTFEPDAPGSDEHMRPRFF